MQGQRQQPSRYESVEADVVTDFGGGQLHDEGDKEQERRDVPEHDASRDVRDHCVAKQRSRYHDMTVLILTYLLFHFISSAE
jgi:hypothetical protein